MHIIIGLCFRVSNSSLLAIKSSLHLHIQNISSFICHIYIKASSSVYNFFEIYAFKYFCATQFINIFLSLFFFCISVILLIIFFCHITLFLPQVYGTFKNIYFHIVPYIVNHFSHCYYCITFNYIFGDGLNYSFDFLESSLLLSTSNTCWILSRQLSNPFLYHIPLF